MKNVFVLAGDSGLGPGLLEQLRIFGITVHEVPTADEVRRLSLALGDGIVIVDLARVHREPALVGELKALKERLGQKSRLVYYADRDDFQVRLEAVRAGGEALFQLPIDASILSEKLDSLFMEREAPPYKVLVVDDDPEQASYNALVLENAGMTAVVATDPAMVIPLLVDERPEMILMDVYMPGCTGPELAAVIRQNEAFDDISIVFLSVETDLEKQIMAVSKGGDAFLEKPIKPEHLVANVAIRAERTRSIRYFMGRDALTGLFDHATLVERLGSELLRARRSGAILSFAKVDIDGLRKVNDRFGHLAGDRVIKSLARLLSERLRRTDVVGRLGGQEFGIILPEAECKRAVKLMEDLRENFGHLRFHSDEDEYGVTFSCGIATYPEKVSASELLETADRALKRAKSSGRDRIVAESPEH
ncbi:MAG: diguanylate cyclase [Spirochaetaceae bacterium]|nr:diguanylate cyclase [Spirochaetaceae bacterium]